MEQVMYMKNLQAVYIVPDSEGAEIVVLKMAHSSKLLCVLS